MRSSKMSILALASLSIGAFAHADDSALRDELVSNLMFMKGVYSAEYAPAEWKKSYAGWDLTTQINLAVADAQKPDLNLKGAQKILRNFIYSMKDYHTSISFVSTETASLGFFAKGVNGKYFIQFIDRTKLPMDSFPFSVGDELVSFGDMPTAQAVAQVQAEIPANILSTDLALAELNLTRRRAARGLMVPQGPIMIQVKPQGSDKVQSLQLIWDYTREQIKDPGFGILSVGRTAPTPSLLRPQMSVSSDLVDAAPENPFGLGTRKAFTPDLGTKIFETASDDPFYAYIYKDATGKMIGYFRLPSYEADDLPRAMASFTRIVGLFQATTDSMIIDQVNNPGGSVLYLYALASMLTDQPLYTPLHKMAITQADVADALTQLAQLQNVKTDADAKKVLGETVEGYPVSYEMSQFMMSYLKFVVSEWNAGRKLTTPYWIAGVDKINPAAVHYSKPILLLTNSLDFSGGDFFPAIMQDNKRVTIMGTRTAGAGGYVNDVTIPNNLGIAAFRVTESIAKRVDDNPIENLGIKPDVDYSFTEKDMTNNYSDYVKAIQSAASLLK